MPTEVIEETLCSGCNSPIPDGEEVEARDRWVGQLFCSNCVTECGYCESHYYWFTDHTYYCDGCGDRFCPDSDYTYCDDCEEYRCEDCGSCRCCSSQIHHYDWTPPSYKPKGNYPEEVLMGMELEVGEDRWSILDAVRSVDDSEYHLYVKKDGSITGAEIVTHPMTLRWARGWKFDELLRRLRNNGCYSEHGYGLHIHVSRNAFRRYVEKGGKGTARFARSTSHQMTWLLFIYRNVEELMALSRRDEDDLGEWASFNKPRSGELRAKAIGHTHFDRYVAVNCQNARTFELRFFQSTLDDCEMFAALEFADASVEYTRQLKSVDILKGEALSWEAFTEWVDGHDYPNLSSQIHDLT